MAEARVARGAVTSVSAEQGVVSVRSGTGVLEFKVASDTLVLLNKRPATLSNFEAGRDVTVRYRGSDQPPSRAYDLVDTPTWSWLQRMRREITEVTLSGFDDKGMDAVDVASDAPFRYRVTDKTRTQVGGKAVALADMPLGTHLFVAPRLLPNGSTMAVAVADSALLAARLSERSQPTVTGTVRSWSAADRTLAVRSRAGDDRSLTLAADCIIRRDGRNAAVSSLRVGMTVTAHVRRDSSGGEKVVRLTIQKAPPSEDKKKAR